MVPPVTPPTDSLYKFMAIGGLVLLITGLTYPQLRRDTLASLQVEGAKQRAEGIAAGIQVGVAMKRNEETLLKTSPPEKHKEIGEMYAKWYADIQRVNRADDTLGLMKIMREMALEYPDLGESVKDYHRRWEIGQGLRTEIERQTRTLFWWRVFGYGMSIVGAVVGVLGFWLWHRRSQSIQDELLRKQVSEEVSHWKLDHGELVRADAVKP